MPPSKRQRKLEAEKGWRDIAKDAQHLRDRSLSSFLHGVDLKLRDLPKNVTAVPDEVLTPDHVKLTNLSIEEIVSLASFRTIPVHDIIQAFLHRAAVAQKLVSLYHR